MHEEGGSGQRRRGERPVNGDRPEARREPEQRRRGRHATDTPQKWPDHWFEPRPSAAASRRRASEGRQGRRYASDAQEQPRDGAAYPRPPQFRPSPTPPADRRRERPSGAAGSTAGLSREQWPAIRVPQEPTHDTPGQAQPRPRAAATRMSEPSAARERSTNTRAAHPRAAQTRVQEAVPAPAQPRPKRGHGYADERELTPEEHQRPAGETKRRKNPASSWTYLVRRAAAVLVALVVLFVVLRACGIIGGQEEEQEVAPPPSTTQSVDEVVPSHPLEMTVPKVGLHAKFEKDVCLFKDGSIDPSTLSEACVYTADDRPYSLPGTSASDIVVVAGHAAAGVPAIFDKLYDPSNEHHTVAVGDALYVRTEQSGDRWLKYEATDLHEPEKTALAQSQEIWGTGPMPGRLLTVTCIQPANPFAPSVKNAVVGWQLQGVVPAEEAQLNG